jgi:hypothetical protein
VFRSDGITRQQLMDRDVLSYINDLLSSKHHSISEIDYSSLGKPDPQLSDVNVVDENRDPFINLEPAKVA